MPRFRKRVIVVEAWQARTHFDFAALCRWIEQKGGQARILDEKQMEVHSAAGPLRVNVGDWVVKGANGYFYRCGAEEFAETYEPLAPPYRGSVDDAT